MSLTTIDRWLVWYLRRRGWTVFWLEPERECANVKNEHDCWLAVYRGTCAILRAEEIEEKIK